MKKKLLLLPLVLVACTEQKVEQADSGMRSSAVAVSSMPIGIPNPPFGLTEGQPASGPVSTSPPSGTVTGPATFKLSGNIGSLSFTGNGSASSWIYVTSANPSSPATIGSLNISGSYIILDGLKFGPNWTNLKEGAHHIAVRNSEFFGNQSGGGFGFGSWSYTGSASLSYVVFDHNNVHDIGNVNATNDQDAHCTSANGSVDHLWVTNNTFTKCSGDSIQVESQPGRRAKVHHIYFGKNTSSGHRQSGGWVKNATDVVFSQNVTHDIKASSGGPGQCYGLQDNGDNLWFIFNEGYNCTLGVFLGSNNVGGTSGKVYILGNYLHDLRTGTNEYDSGGVSARNCGPLVIASNTFKGLAANGVNTLCGSTTVSSNLFTGIAGKSLYTTGSMTASNNLYQSGATFSGTTAGSNAVTGDAKVDSSGRLQSGSPAIDKGVVNAAYSTFQSLYGISIAVDRDGNTRSGTWDIGADEFGGIGPTPTPTPTPTNEPTPPIPTPTPTVSPTPGPTPTPVPTPTPAPGTGPEVVSSTCGSKMTKTPEGNTTKLTFKWSWFAGTCTVIVK